MVSISGSEEEQHISEADRATENFLKGGDLEGTWRMCYKLKRVGSEDCLK